MQTSPTGLPSSSGSGPATPVIATATFAGERAKAPLAISTATSTQTAVFSLSSSGDTPSALILLSLVYETKPPCRKVPAPGASASNPDNLPAVHDSAVTIEQFLAWAAASACLARSASALLKGILQVTNPFIRQSADGRSDRHTNSPEARRWQRWPAQSRLSATAVPGLQQHKCRAQWRAPPAEAPQSRTRIQFSRTADRRRRRTRCGAATQAPSTAEPPSPNSTEPRHERLWLPAAILKTPSSMSRSVESRAAPVSRE